MEIYPLDYLYRRIFVIDDFESLIWTERFNAYGDFELTTHAVRRNRNLFPIGLRIAMNESNRVMTVESVEDSVDANGEAMLKIKGRSLERILEDRVALSALTNTKDNPKWIITGLPADIARQIYHYTCVANTLQPLDVILVISEGTIYPPSDIPEPTDTITYEMDPQTAYAALTDLCESYDMGFRIVRDAYGNDLYFDVYMGNDRSSSQTEYPAVVFSPNLENLQNTTEFSSIADYKTVAYVISAVGHEIVYAPGTDQNIGGLNRRVLLVKVDDIQEGDDPTEASEKMIRRGKEELAKSRRLSAYDGEISEYNGYKYGVHYNLGDLVEVQNVDGAVNKMQVTEQIFVSDKEGERSYPTLTLNQFIMPGTWEAWDYSQVWADMGPTEYWANQ